VFDDGIVKLANLICSYCKLCIAISTILPAWSEKVNELLTGDPAVIFSIPAIYSGGLVPALKTLTSVKGFILVKATETFSFTVTVPEERFVKDGASPPSTTFKVKSPVPPGGLNNNAEPDDEPDT